MLLNREIPWCLPMITTSSPFSLTTVTPGANTLIKPPPPALRRRNEGGKTASLLQRSDLALLLLRRACLSQIGLVSHEHAFSLFTNLRLRSQVMIGEWVTLVEIVHFPKVAYLSVFILFPNLGLTSINTWERRKGRKEKRINRPFCPLSLQLTFRQNSVWCTSQPGWAAHAVASH